MTQTRPRSFVESRLFWAAMLAAVFGLLAWGRLNNVRTFTFDVPLDTITSVEVALQLSATPTQIDTDTSSLLSTQIATNGLVELDVNRSTSSAFIDVRYFQPSFLVEALFGVGRARHNWDIHLNPEAATTLSVEGGTLEADLRDLNLSHLTITGGEGATVLLPTTDDRYRVTVASAADVTIPDGASLDMMIEGDVGSVTAIAGENVEARIEINTTLGDFTLDVPEGAPVRVEGVPAAALPGAFAQVEDGIYQTASYPGASPRITVIYAGSLGDFTVR